MMLQCWIISILRSKGIHKSQNDSPTLGFLKFYPLMQDIQPYTTIPYTCTTILKIHANLSIGFWVIECHIHTRTECVGYDNSKTCGKIETHRRTETERNSIVCKTYTVIYIKPVYTLSEVAVYLQSLEEDYTSLPLLEAFIRRSSISF